MGCRPMAVRVAAVLGWLVAIGVADPNVIGVTSPVAPRDCPYVGNGFVSYRLCDPIGAVRPTGGLGAQDPHEGGMHAAFVYNGFHNASTPSHRAHIPAVYNVQVAAQGNTTTTMISATLDVRSGAVTNRTTVRGASGSQATVEVVQYAHRKYRQLVVLEVNVVEWSGSAPLSVAFAHLGEVPGMVDLDFEASTTPFPDGVDVWKGRTRTPETASTPHTEVAVAYRPVPSSLVVSAKESHLFLAVVRTTQEDGVTDVVSEAVALHKKLSLLSAATLRDDNLAAWGEVWASGIAIEGNDTVARAVNASLYYILASIRSDGPFGMSSCGLGSDGYWGRTYWDQEMFILPGLLLVAPQLAERLVLYRKAQIPAATDQARWSGYKGTMFAWQSATTGYDCSQPGVQFGKMEQHINGDIAVASRTYFRGTGNVSFVEQHAWPIARGVCEFWASRVTRHAESGNWTVLNVVPPDEHAGVRNSSVYTNAVASQAMAWCLEIAGLIGTTVPPLWEDIASRPYLPLMTTSEGVVHPEYEGYSGGEVNQDDVGLLIFPLELPLPDAVKRSDLAYYMARTPRDGMFTGDSMYSIASAQLRNYTMAAQAWHAAFDHMTGGFYAWRERVSGGALNFLTGAGGYIMNVLYGYGGIRLHGNGTMEITPRLPPDNVTRVHFRKLHFREALLDISFDHSSVTVDSDPPATAVDSSGRSHRTPCTLPLQTLRIVPS
eukprot:Sspe_Gene.59590::Locus_32757_Transcript_2_3_Confidence_0.500_Length_8529::g.59590::m.59590/K22078/PGGHG, ATHL1; protein-glucosylgalactosylhydroxylysine glucosidase